MKFTKNQIKRIYEITYQANQNRGIKRQLIIDDVVIESLTNLKEYENTYFLPEKTIPANWGRSEKFRVDALGYNKKNEVNNIVLIKAPASSVGKNFVNYMNGLCGEINRINVSDDVNLILVTFVPRITPKFKRDEYHSISSFDENDHTFLTKSNIVFKRNITEVVVMFDIEDIELTQYKDDVKNLFVNGKNPIKNIEIFTNHYKRPKFINE